MSHTNWQPGANLSILQSRAKLYRTLRHFFDARNVLEVDIPLLASSAGTDPFIELIPAKACQQQCYLQTSPEFFMKRLLASGSGDIYSLGKAFRNEESGRRHNPEFTMLEWYRLGFTDQQLIDEVVELIQHTCGQQTLVKISYRQLFENHFGINPHSCTNATLQQLVEQHIDLAWDNTDRDVWLDLLMSHVLEPAMSEGITVIYDYPASQAALARIHSNPQGDSVGRRFEAYLNGVELANGYWELSDPQEQQQRFSQDQQKRHAMQLDSAPVDEKLLAALESGLPDCAGVALGVDRLLMAMTQCSDIDQVMSFSFART